MPNAESAVSRITRLCAVVDRPKLAAWIGGRDAFKKLPQSSFVQRLFQGTTYVDVLCGLTSMVCRCDVSIDGSMLEELAAELAAMPQVSEFPEDFWHKYPIDAVLAKYDTITSRIKVSTTSSVKLVGKFDSHRCVASTATEMGVATQIAEALNSSLSVILYGESGSGKTTAMLLAAVALADTMNKDQLTALALYTDLSGIEDRFRSIENPTQAPMDAARCTLRAGEVRVHPLEGVDWEDACGCRLCTRDHEAAKILVALCGVLRTEGDAVQPYHAVIVVDEQLPVVRTRCLRLGAAAPHSPCSASPPGKGQHRDGRNGQRVPRPEPRVTPQHAQADSCDDQPVACVGEVNAWLADPV